MPLYHHTTTSQALAHRLITYLFHGAQEVRLIGLGVREQGDARGVQ